jgi:hypothetical protein
MSDPRTPGAELAREEVLAALRADIGERIRPVVAHLPAESVDELIQRMARIQYKYEGAEMRRAITVVRRGAPDGASD